MKNVKLSFSPIVVILFMLFIVNMLLILINRNSINLWSYFIFSGITPIIILSVGNAFLFGRNRLKDVTLAVIVISILETALMLMFSSMIDLQRVIDNTTKSGGDFSISASVDNNIVGNFLTSWLPLVGISLIITTLVTIRNRRKQVNNKNEKSYW